MKSREAHGVRALLSTRKALLNKTIDLANEVRGLLKIFGLRLPKTVHLVNRENIHICAACHFKVNEPECSRRNTKEPPSKAALYRFK